MKKSNADYKNFVLPETYWTGATAYNLDEIARYLTDTDQKDFLLDLVEARKQGLSEGEVLCSMYAKLCYKSLVMGKNNNLTRIREIGDNIESTILSGHGSVFEHCQLNFLLTDVSRIFTHELVRHRVGTAFSQTSGRYVRGDTLNLIIDPILAPIYDDIEELRKYTEVWYNKMVDKLGLKDATKFGDKKKLTSALRRMLPNGQANEIGFSCNLRSLRHLVELRTSRHAEWEIRYVFNQIYDLVHAKFPAIFADADATMVDSLPEITFKNKKI